MSYSSEILSDSPAAWWRMDEASGFPQDSSGNGHHMDNTGGPGVGYSYQQTGAILTDTASKSIKFPGDSGFRVTGPTGINVGDVFTLEVWWKLATLGTQQVICQKDTNAYSFRKLADNTIQLSCQSVSDVVASTTTLSRTGVYYHCVATKNGSTVKLYINGADVTGTVTNQTFSDNANDLWVGLSTSGTSGTDGYLDEFAIYGTALSATRVLAHYNAGLGLFGGGPNIGLLKWMGH